MKAIKTEYKGVYKLEPTVFDSKSEAVFARTLDLAGIEWAYHVDHCDHNWDFLTWGHNWRPSILVEYKPKMPTNTYIHNLTEKMRDDPRESVIIWGNPWDGFDPEWPVPPPPCSYIVYPIFTKFGKFGWGNYIPLADHGWNEPFSTYHNMFGMFGIYEEIVQEAKNYRFDLVEA